MSCMLPYYGNLKNPPLGHSSLILTAVPHGG